MSDFNYIVMNTKSGNPIAQFGLLENAIIFLKGLFTEFFNDTDMEYTIKRISVSDDDTVYTILDRTNND